MNESGYLGPSPYPPVQKRINEYHDRLRRTLDTREQTEDYRRRLQEDIRYQDSVIVSQHRKIRELERTIGERDRAVAEQTLSLARLRAIEESLSWRAIRKVLSFADKVIFPANTSRGNLFQSIGDRLRRASPSLSEAVISKPVFILGCMRSGTTLLAEMLGKHKEIVYCPFELREIWSKVGGVPMAAPKTGDTICPSLGASDVRPGQKDLLSKAFYNEYEKHAAGKHPGARFLSKNPHLCNKLFFLDGLFRDANYIWIRRGMPDVVEGLKRIFSRAFDQQKTWHYWPEKNGEGIRCWHCFFGEAPPGGADRSRCFPGGDVRFFAEYWLENNLAVSQFLNTIHASRSLVVEEEDLVAAPEEVIRRCIAFLGASPDVPMLDDYPIAPMRNRKWAAVLTEEEQRSILAFVKEHVQELGDLMPGKALSGSYARMITEALESRRPA